MESTEHVVYSMPRMATSNNNLVPTPGMLRQPTMEPREARPMDPSQVVRYGGPVLSRPPVLVVSQSYEQGRQGMPDAQRGQYVLQQQAVHQPQHEVHGLQLGVQPRLFLQQEHISNQTLSRPQVLLHSPVHRVPLVQQPRMPPVQQRGGLVLQQPQQQSQFSPRGPLIMQQHPRGPILVQHQPRGAFVVQQQQGMPVLQRQPRPLQGQQQIVTSGLPQQQFVTSGLPQHQILTPGVQQQQQISGMQQQLRLPMQPRFAPLPGQERPPLGRLQQSMPASLPRSSVAMVRLPRPVPETVRHPTPPQPQSVGPESNDEPVRSVSVPWGWRRYVVAENVVYFSPSGVQIKSIDELSAYLTKEGTCKCGLECPLHLDSAFDFDSKKPSKTSGSVLPSKDPRYESCHHKKVLMALASSDHSPEAVMVRIKHVHHPHGTNQARKAGKKRKKRALSSEKLAEMMEARENERQRINEIIEKEKRHHESRMSALVQQTSVESFDEDSSADTTSRSSDVSAKISEIRRLSATDEGDQVLSEAFHSPDKEGSTPPLQMVENIVSNLKPQIPSSRSSPASKSTKKGNKKHSHVSSPQPSAMPSWTVQGQANVEVSSANYGPSCIRPRAMHSMPTRPQEMISPQYTFPPGARLLSPQQGVQLVPGQTSPGQYAMVHQPVMSQGGIVSNNVASLVSPTRTKNEKKKKGESITPSSSPMMSSVIVSQQNMAPGMALHPGMALLPPQQTFIPQPTPQLVAMAPQPQILLNAPTLLTSVPTANVVVNANGNLFQLQPVQSTSTSMQQMLVMPVPNASTLQASPVLLTSGAPLTMVEPPKPSSLPSNVLPTKPSLLTGIRRESSTSDSTTITTATTNSEASQEMRAVEEDEENHMDIEMEENEEAEDDETEPDTSKEVSESRLANVSFIQSNQVDSSGLQATPPHMVDSDLSVELSSLPNVITIADDDDNNDGGEANLSSRGQQRRRKRPVEEVLRDEPQTRSPQSRYSPSGSKVSGNFCVGELVWGPQGSFPSWPGKIVKALSKSDRVRVAWFGDVAPHEGVSVVPARELKSLSEGLEIHHREHKRLRKGRKMSSGLERAINEAMADLDRMTQ